MKATKENIEKLINKLADNAYYRFCHSCDFSHPLQEWEGICPVCGSDSIKTEKQQKSILIGDVLFAIRSVWQPDISIVQKECDDSRKLIRLWYLCEIKRSLQEIFSEWEHERLKSPEARALAEFLLTLFPEK